jgi:hypothetical protein
MQTGQRAMDTTGRQNDTSALAPINALLTRYEPVSLEGIGKAALLDRVDTKYLLGMRQLSDALDRLSGDYRVLCINQARLNPYHTVYFDTRDFTLYGQHHNGLGERYKVRARTYVSTDVSFFEIKHRTNRRRTIKTRLPIGAAQSRIDAHSEAFVEANTPFDGSDLIPVLWNDYQRITLVSKDSPERVTLDLGVQFGWEGAETALPGVCIAEVKQSRLTRDSAFLRQMRAMGIRPAGFSKYCAGVALTYRHVKQNNFKPQLRHLFKLMQGEQA